MSDDEGVFLIKQGKQVGCVLYAHVLHRPGMLANSERTCPAEALWPLPLNLEVLKFLDRLSYDDTVVGFLRRLFVLSSKSRCDANRCRCEHYENRGKLHFVL